MQVEGTQVGGNSTSNSKVHIYCYLRDCFELDKAATCSILANIEKSSNYSTAAGTESNGSEPYGLLGWKGTRKESLKTWCSKKNLSYKSIQGQLEFMNSEMKSRKVPIPSGVDTVDEAVFYAQVFYSYYILSGDKKLDSYNSDERKELKDRQDLAKALYESIDDNSMLIQSYFRGNRVVWIARSQLGRKYKKNGNGDNGGFDQAGLIYYCYQQAGVYIPEASVFDYYKTYEKLVDYSDMAPGDLIFTSSKFFLDDGVDEVAIATGEGYKITVTQADGVIATPIGTKPYVVARVLPKASISFITGDDESDDSDDSDVEDDGADYVIVSNSAQIEAVKKFPYSNKVTTNLTNVKKSGFNYGYLIDIVNGGEFKFPIPEFSESAGANWESVEIVGRSVTVLAYKSTNSRVVDITLELYAGEGFYKDSIASDIVGELHDDVNFIKSLEYPDYSSNSLTKPPSTVYLILGSTLSMLGVVSGVSVSHLKPIDDQGRSMYIKVSFKVTQIAQDPPDYSDIRTGFYHVSS